MTDKKLAVLISGTGSLLEAMIKSNLPITLVLIDRPCRGAKFANEAGIPVALIDRSQFKSDEGFRRKVFTSAVAESLKNHWITHVAMAGFMTILAEEIFTTHGFAGRFMNSHPSLLPAFKGESAVKDALNFGVKVTGTTIHIATARLDDGPILAQEAVLVEDGDTVDTLWERIKESERRLYPEIIRSHWGFEE